MLRAALLTSISGVVHGFSTRTAPDGSGERFDLGMPAGAESNRVNRLREQFARAVIADCAGSAKSRKWPLVSVTQVHSDKVHMVANGEEAVGAGDGLITSQPGVLLGIKTADCVPVLIADVNARAVGAFHAGWRGTLGRIVEKGVGMMRLNFGVAPQDLRAAIGPCIHACCYEVSGELRDQFASQFEYAGELFQQVSGSDAVRERYPLLFLNMRAPGHGLPPEKPHLDLVEANRRQLLAAGLNADAIEASSLCTSCRRDLLFSHRAEAGSAGRMMTAIGICPR